ncbi:hypothetical protein O5477_26720, partial [Escherichia coli]|nr:hypothetical protein [Escherichia coli]
MHLARVTGTVVATQKSLSLVGKKLLLVRRVTAEGEFSKRIKLLAPLLKAWKSALKAENAVDFSGL